MEGDVSSASALSSTQNQRLELSHPKSVYPTKTLNHIPIGGSGSSSTSNLSSPPPSVPPSTGAKVCWVDRLPPNL